MKKGFLRFGLMLLLIISVKISQAQIISKNNLLPAEVEDIKSRTLIVELLKEDPKRIEKLKAAGKNDEVTNYRNWIIDYNRFIQKYMTNYWTMNVNITYRYADQIQKLVEGEKKVYAFLLYTDLDDKAADVYNFTDLMAPAFMYHRANEPFTKPDVKFPIPSSYIRGRDSLQTSDFIMALMLLQNELGYIREYKGDNRSSYSDYLKSQPKENCKGLNKRTVLLEPGIAAKDLNIEQVLAKAKSDLKITVSNAKANNDIITKTPDGYALLLTIPVNYVKSIKPNDPYVFKKESVAYAKVLVDCRSFKILNTAWPNLGMAYDYTVKDVNIKKLCNCPE